jgi:hypothetical protein
MLLPPMPISAVCRFAVALMGSSAIVSLLDRYTHLMSTLIK